MSPVCFFHDKKCKMFHLPYGNKDLLLFIIGIRRITDETPWNEDAWYTKNVILTMENKILKIWADHKGYVYNKIKTNLSFSLAYVAHFCICLLYTSRCV